MGFDIIPTEIFKKEAKRLRKKFPSLKEELKELDRLLTNNPKSGIDLGHNTFKIRLRLRSARRSSPTILSPTGTFRNMVRFDFAQRPGHFG